AVQHAARGRRAGEGGERFRSPAAAAGAPWLRCGCQLRDAAPVGLLCEEPARCGAAEGVSDWPAAGRAVMQAPCRPLDQANGPIRGGTTNAEVLRSASPF